MCRATKIYLSYFLILNTADLILGFLCGLLPGHTGHGIGYYEAKSAAAEGKGPTGLVPTSEGYRCAFSPSAAEVAEPAQTSSFKGPHSVEIHSSCDDFQTPILALFQLPRGDERVIPTLLEMRTGVGHLQRYLICPTRASTTTILQSAVWTATSMGWSTVAGLELWIMEPPFPSTTTFQPRTQAEQGQWIMARRRSTELPQGSGQRTGAPCSRTGPNATLHAISTDDAPVPSYDDAATFTSTYERQGCRKRLCFPINDDANSINGTSRWNNLYWANYVVGTQWANDAVPYATYGLIQRAGMLTQCAEYHQWAQTGWSGAAATQPPPQGDDEGGRQLVTPPTIHCPRDPKAGREEQHQELVFGCSCIGGCRARVARGRECSCPNVVTMEDISTAVRCEMARVHSQLSGVRKRSSARCASCTICGEAGSEGFRPGLQARTSWQRWTLHHLRQRRYGRPSWRERPESPRRHELHCDQLEELSSTANGDAVNASAAMPFGGVV